MLDRANRAAPVVEMAQAVVNAPIETVWGVLSDLDAWPKWNPSVSSITLSGPVAVGTTFDWVAGGSKIVSKLEMLQPPTQIVWSGKTMGISAIHVWNFEDIDGRTRVRTEESFEGFLPRVLPWVMRRMLRSALESGVEALKVESESRVLGGPV